MHRRAPANTLDHDKWPLAADEIMKIDFIGRGENVRTWRQVFRGHLKQMEGSVVWQVRLGNHLLNLPRWGVLCLEALENFSRARAFLCS